MKKIAKRIFNKLKYHYSRYRLTKLITSKNKLLIKKQIFKKFPINETLPVISNYNFYHKSDNLWLDFFYSTYLKPDNKFIPLTTYYQVIEPLLNQYPLLKAIKEKNYYNKNYPEVKTPRTLLRRMNGHFYDAEYQLVNLNNNWINTKFTKENEIILKPSVDSGSGKAIIKFVKRDGIFKDDKITLDTKYLHKFSQDFIIQEVVRQHQYYRSFNPDSNNTLRVFTYRSVITDDVHELHTILRIGKRGSYLDHDNLGGVAIGIDNNNNLTEYAFDVYGNKYTEFNGIVFKNTQTAPTVEETKKIAIEIAKEIYYGRLLAFDFTIDTNGNPLLIEINCQSNGISQYQMNSGSLFKEFTKEILDYCQKNYRK